MQMSLINRVFNKSRKNRKRFSSKSENDFLQNQKTIFSNQETIFCKIKKTIFLQNPKTIFFKISNTKVGHILHKSMTHSLHIFSPCVDIQKIVNLSFYIIQSIDLASSLDATFE